MCYVKADVILGAGARLIGCPCPTVAVRRLASLYLGATSNQPLLRGLNPALLQTVLFNLS